MLFFFSIELYVVGTCGSHFNKAIVSGNPNMFLKRNKKKYRLCHHCFSLSEALVLRTYVSANTDGANIL